MGLLRDSEARRIAGSSCVERRILQWGDISNGYGGIPYPAILLYSRMLEEMSAERATPTTKSDA